MLVSYFEGSFFFLKYVGRGLGFSLFYKDIQFSLCGLLKRETRFHQYLFLFLLSKISESISALSALVSMSALLQRHDRLVTITL